jgi:hypothetical protein
LAAINHRRRRNQPRRRERRERLEPLERREHREHREHLRQHQKKNRRGISGYILAKKIYPKSMKEGVTFILDVPKGMLDKARGFDKNNWPDVSDPQWRQETYGYYGAKPYWD